MSSKFHKSGTLLILAVSLVSGCSQKPKIDNALSQPNNSVAVPDTRPKPPSTSVSSPPRLLTVFLPGEDGKLHPIKFQEPTDIAQLNQWEESPLILLFRKAPQIIPVDTRLTDSIRKNKEYNREYPDSDIYTVFEVRLNKEFLSSPIWRDDKKAKLAFDAIVKTATNSINESIHPTYPFSIHVLVAEKPVTKIGRVKVKNPA